LEKPRGALGRNVGEPQPKRRFTAENTEIAETSEDLYDLTG
jgi:hypothetical protein